MTDLPAAYATRGLDDLQRIAGNAEALDWCHDWLDGKTKFARGLVLAGEPGTGKTAIAAALAVEAIESSIDTAFVSAPNLRAGFMRQMDLMDIIRKMSVVDDETNELIEHRHRSEVHWLWNNETTLLVIDDLGRELATKSGGRFVADLFDNLLRNRGDRGLATVITTNLTRTERQRRYSEALESYLHGVCDFIQVDGGDWRRGEG